MHFPPRNDADAIRHKNYKRVRNASMLEFQKAIDEEKATIDELESSIEGLKQDKKTLEDQIKELEDEIKEAAANIKNFEGALDKNGKNDANSINSQMKNELAKEVNDINNIAGLTAEEIAELKKLQAGGGNFHLLSPGLLEKLNLPEELKIKLREAFEKAQHVRPEVDNLQEERIEHQESKKHMLTEETHHLISTIGGESSLLEETSYQEALQRHEEVHARHRQLSAEVSKLHQRALAKKLLKLNDQVLAQKAEREASLAAAV